MDSSSDSNVRVLADFTTLTSSSESASCQSISEIISQSISQSVSEIISQTDRQTDRQTNTKTDMSNEYKKISNCTCVNSTKESKKRLQ
jgi:hypothetical protein